MSSSFMKKTSKMINIYIVNSHWHYLFMGADESNNNLWFLKKILIFYWLFLTLVNIKMWSVTIIISKSRRLDPASKTQSDVFCIICWYDTQIHLSVVDFICLVVHILWTLFSGPFFFFFQILKLCNITESLKNRTITMVHIHPSLPNTAIVRSHAFSSTVLYPDQLLDL